MQEETYSHLPPIPAHPKLSDARFHKDDASGKPYLSISDEPVEEGGSGSGSSNNNTNKNMIRIIRLNRPEYKNPFNDWMYLAVADALQQAENDDTVLVVVLTGEGEYFSSGADLGPGENAMELKQFNGNANDPVGIFMLTVMRFPKVLIGAVNGPGVGVGATLIPHCDIAFAADTTYLWTPFARIAVVPEFCSSVLFPQIMGKSVANEMLLLSRQLDANKAKQVGMVADVFPAGKDFLPRVMKEIRTGLAFPLIDQSLPMYKTMINKWDVQKLHEVFYLEMKKLDERADNGDIIEAIVQYQQKRKAAKDAKAASKTQPARL